MTLFVSLRCSLTPLPGHSLTGTHETQKEGNILSLLLNCDLTSTPSSVLSGPPQPPGHSAQCLLCWEPSWNLRTRRGTQPWKAHSVASAFTRMVQSLASVTSGEVTSAVVRDQSHLAHPHPQVLSGREEIGEDLLYQPIMLSHWTWTGFFFSFIVFGFRVPGWVCIMSGKRPGLSFFLWA